MKLVFLDIDGVLNSFEKHADLNMAHNEWCPETLNAFGITLDVFPEQIERVNRITDATGAKLVLSSSWRIGYLADYASVIIHLHNSGIKGFIVGRTPHRHDLKTRGEEIAAWFKDHPDEKIESFIILDDDNKMDPLSNRLVQTDYQKGIQDEQVEKAIIMLKEPASVVHIKETGKICFVNNSLPSVREFIDQARKAGHDSFGIGNDSEALEVIERLKDEREES